MKIISSLGYVDSLNKNWDVVLSFDIILKVETFSIVAFLALRLKVLTREQSLEFFPVKWKPWTWLNPASDLYVPSKENPESPQDLNNLSDIGQLLSPNMWPLRCPLWGCPESKNRSQYLKTWNSKWTVINNWPGRFLDLKGTGKLLLEYWEDAPFRDSEQIRNIHSGTFIFLRQRLWPL